MKKLILGLLLVIFVILFSGCEERKPPEGFKDNRILSYELINEYKETFNLEKGNYSAIKVDYEYFDRDGSVSRKVVFIKNGYFVIARDAEIEYERIEPLGFGRYIVWINNQINTEESKANE